MKPLELIKKIKNNEIDIVSNTKETLKQIKKINSDYNYFIQIDDSYSINEVKSAKTKKNGKLYGLPVSIKDCICVRSLISRAGSKILEGYNPRFDATVITKIKDEGGIIIGKTSQDVFGFGSFNTNVGLGFNIPKNPIDKERVTGGSSGGSAGITNMLDGHIAIAESTGGSIACPAAYCGVYGITPTYGLVSRYGLMDYANSMDKIGVMAKEIESIELMLNVISGYDNKDSTSISDDDIKNITTKKKNTNEIKVALIKESLDNIDKTVKENLLNKLKSKGIKHDIISLPLTFKYGIQTYYLISMSEASTNLSKYCGIRYGASEEFSGNFNEYFTDIRSKYFSKEAKRRIILGTFARMSGFRDAYYIKALKVRTKIIEEYQKHFSKYDILISPTMPNIAPKFSEIKKLTPLQNYMMDIMTVGPNLAGFPHLNIPSGFSENMPTGMLAIANHLCENSLIEFAKVIA